MDWREGDGGRRQDGGCCHGLAGGDAGPGPDQTERRFRAAGFGPPRVFSAPSGDVGQLLKQQEGPCAWAEYGIQKMWFHNSDTLRGV